MPWRTLVIAVVLLVVTPSAYLNADIYRWDNGQVIPGTEGIEPGPGVTLEHHELSFASLPKRDLTLSRFGSSTLTNSYFAGSTLTSANFDYANLTGAVFAECGGRFPVLNGMLHNSSFIGANLRQAAFFGGGDCLPGISDLRESNLTDADMTYSLLVSANVIVQRHFRGTLARLCAFAVAV